jgi:hypothetical protein
MSSAPSTELADSISRYLTACQSHREWVTSSEPLARRVEIRSRVWRPWLSRGGYSGRRSFCGPLPRINASVAIDVLDSLPLVEAPDRGRDRYLDRNLLQQLALAIDSTQSDEALVRLWVATMMWGSGTSYGRGPWRTAQGLGSDQLAQVLRATSEAVTANDLGLAHRRFRVEGTGEAFFTKWFWSRSLSYPRASRRPLILDDRVRGALDRILSENDRWKQPRGERGYIDFVDLTHRCTDLLASHFKHIDAEKVEWLLFDRSSHVRVQEPCLASWP